MTYDQLLIAYNENVAELATAKAELYEAKERLAMKELLLETSFERYFLRYTVLQEKFAETERLLDYYYNLYTGKKQYEEWLEATA